MAYLKENSHTYMSLTGNFGFEEFTTSCHLPIEVLKTSGFLCPNKLYQYYESRILDRFFRSKFMSFKGLEEIQAL